MLHLLVLCTPFHKVLVYYESIRPTTSMQQLIKVRVSTNAPLWSLLKLIQHDNILTLDILSTIQSVLITLGGEQARHGIILVCGVEGHGKVGLRLAISGNVPGTRGYFSLDHCR